MINLPSGTVTFLFTDIQGSTPLWESHPGLMAEALQIHHRALRQAIEANGGAVFKTVGDAFQAAFATAPAALKAAIQGQSLLLSAPWNELGPLTVRMGLHTGEAELDPDGDEYSVSHAKNRIGRIHSAAHGGQILLSQETADLVLRVLPDGVTLHDLGEHHLKGLAWPERLYQAVAPGLPSKFPPLPTGARHPHNLPQQLTSFIGREAEIEAVCRLAATHRLVTITGSGGTGKTRLSLQAGERLLDRFPQGVWLVELAPLSDAALVPRAVARALGVSEKPGQPIQQVLVDYLQSRPALLILDNCEHVVAEASALAARLLGACPHLHLLATSREILGVAGEVPFRCPSLSLPDAKHLPPFAQLAQFEAVRLFSERAQAVCPDFSLNESDAPLIARICRRLDGIPLAIELAAARARMLSLEQIADRLDHSFRLLTGGSRSVLPRHQTLRALIDWSYNLLSPQERILLLRLSIFAGGWTLEAAEQVCAGQEDGLGEDQRQPEEMVEVLGQMIDKSLIQFETDRGAEPRYRMLETVRQYAHDRLAEGGGGEAVRERHLDYFLALAARAEPHLRAREAKRWLDRLEQELDNLRLALEWSLSGSIAKGLRLAAALMWFWHIRHHRLEGVEWIGFLSGKQAIQPDDQRIDLDGRIARGKALNAASMLELNLSLTGTYQQTKELSLESAAIFQEMGEAYQWDFGFARFNLASTVQDFQECRDLFHKLNDPLFTAECDQKLGWLYIEKINIDQASVYFAENLAMRKAMGDLDGEGSALHDLAILAFNRGFLTQAVELMKKSLACYETVGNRERVAKVYSMLGHFSICLGDYQQAMRYIEIGRTIGRELASQQRLISACSMQGYVAWARKEYGAAVQCCEEALEMARDFPLLRISPLYILARVSLSQGEVALSRTFLEELLLDMQGRARIFWPPMTWPSEALVIQTSGVLAATEGQMAEDRLPCMERTAIIFGAQEALSSWTMNILSPPERREYEQALAACRATLGEAAFSAAWEKGRSLTIAQAWQTALEKDPA